jgi:hypothetical protein
VVVVVVAAVVVVVGIVVVVVVVVAPWYSASTSAALKALPNIFTSSNVPLKYPVLSLRLPICRPLAVPKPQLSAMPSSRVAPFT